MTRSGSSACFTRHGNVSERPVASASYGLLRFEAWRVTETSPHSVRVEQLAELGRVAKHEDDDDAPRRRAARPRRADALPESFGDSPPARHAWHRHDR